jgi:hypothetical protein
MSRPDLRIMSVVTQPSLVPLSSWILSSRAGLALTSISSKWSSSTAHTSFP